MEEVRNQTGYGKRVERYADAVAVNLWPSRGLEVLGFEVKASRRDWVKELKSPDKSVEIQQYCDRWWIVAGGRNIVRAGELPPTWGLLVVHGNGGKRRLVCTQEAPKLEPKELDKSFLLSMLRRAAEREKLVLEGSGDENYQRGWKDGLKRGEENKDWKSESLERDLKILRRSIQQFEQASGVKLSQHRQWEWGDIGMAVRAVLQHVRHPDNGHREALRRAQEPLRACLNAMISLDKAFDLLEGGGDHGTQRVS